MSSGSWLSHGAAANEGIGTTPGLMGPEEKLFLGWLDYADGERRAERHRHARPGAGRQRAQGPGGQGQPARHHDAPTTYTTPTSGTHAWWTGSADDLNNTLTRAVPGGASRVTVTANAWYDIEAGYDYLYAEYSTDGGATLDARRPAGSRVVQRQVDRRCATPTPPAARPTLFRFRYQTDGGVHLRRRVPRRHRRQVRRHDVVHRRRRERRPTAGPPTGCGSVSTGTETATSRALLPAREPAVRRLRRHPAHRARTSSARRYTAPDWVELFPFQDGMLVWYVDESYADNNTIEHPGGGLRAAGRRPPGAVQLPGRHQPEQPAPAVRRDLRPAAT